MFVNRYITIELPVEYLLVLLEVRFCIFPIYVHYMMDQINRLDSHEPCVFILEFWYVRVFNGFYYLVLEGLAHGCGILNIWRAFPYILLDFGRWATVAFLVMVGIDTGSFGYFHGVTITNVVYRVSFSIRPTWPCFPTSGVVLRVTALAYNDWIISFKDSYSGSLLIVVRVLMTN